ncbi:MAG: hypothetical protein P1P90_06570 [Patescibacteria group bacterium]|nr:hypothetical protein [Patescibacteria group bacterium]
MNTADTKTVGQNDNIIKVEILTIPVAKLASEIARLELTVDRIAGIFYDATTGNVHVPFISGTLDAKTKGKTLVATPDFPALMAWTNIEGIQTFEIFGKTNFDPISWLPVLDQLKNFKDKYGNTVTEFYGVGYAIKTTRQFVVLADKRVLNLTPENSVGITSLRYDFANRRYYGILLDTRFYGTSIITIEMDTVMQKPTVIVDVKAWDTIVANVQPGMISLSRVKIVDGFVAFYVNQYGNVCKGITLNTIADETIASWDDSVRTPIMMIGSVSNDGLYVGYVPTADDQIAIYLDSPKPREFPFLTLSL